MTAYPNPADKTVSWSSSNNLVASVSSGTVTGVDPGTAVITASVTIDGTTYTDTCTVTVTAT